MMETLITPHFCEVMYAHYGELQQRKDIDPIAKEMAAECQWYYLQMHSILVDFHHYAEQLGF